MAWRCKACREIHTTNPSACRECGGHVFEQVRLSDVESTTQNDATTAYDIPDNRVIGTAREPEYESSPDVGSDGSLTSPSKLPPIQPDDSRTRNLIRGIYYKIRGTVRAFGWFLWHYKGPLGVLVMTLVFTIYLWP